ncbi:MAG: histidine phosphatase family protein [Saprospiraceae bacterium]|nr:histidine phosphatase family protein [Candidatus Vicinibacter proximus]MBL7823825.1 histidine phosphatase family protein [Saprospiraceae bacterium]MCC6841919.1 histidine phosphatase family protein [Saprospiraceae bacterium]HRG34094.1 histidine phosphatase family protein [Saprospiraceae bacterium]
MHPKEVYFIRHGETEQNKLGIVQGSGIDSDLNKLGLIQGKAFHTNFLDKEFDVAISSDMKRAYQTIQFFENHKLVIERDPRIKEICWGEHEGKQGDPELLTKYYKIIESWKSGDYHVSALFGESAAEMEARLIEFLNDLEFREARRVLVCTHGRTLRALVCKLKNWPLSRMEEIEHSNTGLYHCIYDGKSWEIIKENYLGHLNGI